ncbi:MAG: hypothetical protein HFG68_15185 [Hungatella sp.]|nr:hypothetical protein [Hungatella sp.]
MKNIQNLTWISQNNISKLKQKDMTPQEIIAFLENGAVYRTFEDVLSKVYSKDDLKKVLTDQLQHINHISRDNAARTVRNWLNGKDIPRREMLFKICFALHLDALSSNQLIASTSETGIHYRNPKELIYAYCLSKGKTYEEAVILNKKLRPIYGTVSKPDKTLDIDRANVYTRQIQRDFESQVDSDEKLEQFFHSNARVFGLLHETAYHQFIKMLDFLLNPDKEYQNDTYNYMIKHKDEFDETVLKRLEEHQKGLEGRSLESVMEDFLQMHVPKNQKRGKANTRNLSYLQHVIKKNWPSEDILEKMKNREIDVSRKVLLLLFLLTEEFEVSDPIETEENFSYLDELDDEDETIRMEVRLHQINLFLDSYGMNLLDPGSPFDCLILYALKASYTNGEDSSMSSRLAQALSVLFDEE